MALLESRGWSIEMVPENQAAVVRVRVCWQGIAYVDSRLSWEAFQVWISELLGQIGEDVRLG